MGYANHELITPAILLDNPGLNRNQLQQKLQQTHFSDGEVKVGEPWDAHDKSFTLEDLPKILNLKYSRAFMDFQGTIVGSDGLPTYGPRMEVFFGNQPENFWSVEGYKVTRRIGSDLGPQKIIRKFDDVDGDTPRVGGVVYVDDESLGWESYLINDIRGKRLQVQKITPVLDIQTFTSLEELYKSWPQFRPENMYDFSQSHGNFDFFRGGKSFLWKVMDNRYYLDEKTFDKISAGFFHGSYEFGYVDLILTAEAIRQKAWKLLSYRGLTHLDAFVTEFPDSKARYEQAVWDSHTSLFAKREGMTTTDFLRMRLFPQAVLDEYK